MISEKIKKLREQKNLSMRQLAKKLNISYATISLWESNKRTPTLDVVCKLAEELNVPIGYFFEDKQNSNLEEAVRANNVNITQKECINIILSLPENLLYRAESYLKALSDANSEFTLKKLN